MWPRGDVEFFPALLLFNMFNLNLCLHTAISIVRIHLGFVRFALFAHGIVENTPNKTDTKSKNGDQTKISSISNQNKDKRSIKARHKIVNDSSKYVVSLPTSEQINYGLDLRLRARIQAAPIHHAKWKMAHGAMADIWHNARSALASYNTKRNGIDCCDDCRANWHRSAIKRIRKTFRL